MGWVGQLRGGKPWAGIIALIWLVRFVVFLQSSDANTQPRPYDFDFTTHVKRGPR